MSVRNAIAVLLLSLATFSLLSAQTASQPEVAPSAAIIRSTRREVLVDLVVRDKHQRPIANLRPDEVAVYEDGALQKLNVFRKVAGAEQLQSERIDSKKDSDKHAIAAGSETEVPVTTVRQVNFVAVVMAEIAPLNLEFAREAVHDFLNSGDLPNTYVSIYRLNRTLSVVQYFTSDKALLEKAVEAATRGAHAHDNISTDAAVIGAGLSSLQAIGEKILARPNLDTTTQLAVRNALLSPIPSIAHDPLFARNASDLDVSVTLGNAILAQARIEDGLKFATSLSNGMDALDSLREIVRSEENLPGRKVVLYLSDGLDFPMDRRDAVDSLVSYANRAGVAFYTVDTRGLKFEDPMMRSLSELQRTAAISSVQSIDPVTGHKEDDNILLTVSSNKQLSMRELAESTGGFPIANTNEIAAPMQRVMEDIRSHYELAYTPTSSNYDGRFRKIDIKIMRPHVTVQTRKGYFALPDVNGKPLQPFEAIALNAINSHAPSHDVSYNVAVMKFRPLEDRIQHQVAFDIPVSSLRTKPGASGKNSIRAGLVALIRNQSGEIIAKIGRELARTVMEPAARIADDDHILYEELVELPPGHYIMDTAVTDELAARTSVKRVALYVPPEKDFGLSSLELVRDQDNSSSQSSIVLAAAENRTLPVLSDSIPSTKPVYLYFVVYPGKTQTQPRVSLQVLREGREVARKIVDLPESRPDGSVPIMLKLAPERGHCDILVTAEQDKFIAQSALSVNVR
jgi:VWFA-related protein